MKATSGRNHGRTRRGARERGPAFTLIELLVVISIIVLLISIIVPSFAQIRRLARAASTQARVGDITGGCELFYQDHGRYPGQDTETLGDAPGTGRLNDGGPGNRLYGAYVLVRDLFGWQIRPNGGWDRDVDPKLYADLGEGDLVWVDRPGGEPDGYVVVDRFSDARPILYWPSSGARRGVCDVFVPEWNEPWLRMNPLVDNANGWYEWRRYITNPSYGNPADLEIDPTSSDWTDNVDNIPYRRDSFLVISAGIDKVYVTGDDNTNFTIERDSN